MDKLEKLIEGPTKLLALLAGIATVVMMLHVTADVTTKYLFNYQIQGTIEFEASYNMVMIVFLPLAYLVCHEGLIKVELFTRGLPDRALSKLDGAMGVVTFLFMSAFTWLTAVEAIGRTVEGEVQLTGDDVLIIWPSRWFLPIGGGVMAACVLIRLIKDFRRPAGDRPEALTAPRHDG